MPVQSIDPTFDNLGEPYVVQMGDFDAHNPHQGSISKSDSFDLVPKGMQTEVDYQQSSDQAIRACSRCRKRHVYYGGGRPCESCLRAGQAYSCSSSSKEKLRVPPSSNLFSQIGSWLQNDLDLTPPGVEDVAGSVPRRIDQSPATTSRQAYGRGHSSIPSLDRTEMYATPLWMPLSKLSLHENETEVSNTLSKSSSRYEKAQTSISKSPIESGPTDGHLGKGSVLISSQLSDLPQIRPHTAQNAPHSAPNQERGSHILDNPSGLDIVGHKALMNAVSEEQTIQIVENHALLRYPTNKEALDSTLVKSELDNATNMDAQSCLHCFNKDLECDHRLPSCWQCRHDGVICHYEISKVFSNKKLSRETDDEATITAKTPNPEMPAKISSTMPQEVSSNAESELSFTGAGCYLGTEDSRPFDLDKGTQLFVEELAMRIVQKYTLKSLSKEPSSRASSGKKERTSSSRATSRETPATSLNPSTKRVRSDEGSKKKKIKRAATDGDGEDEDHKDDGSGSDKRRSGKDDPVKLFACPYSKVDPQRYSECNEQEKDYRKCAGKYLLNIARLKQHLYRVHARPKWYCGNCFQEFGSRDESNQHSRQRPPCEEAPAKYEEMMTDEQYDQVKRRNLGPDPRGAWYKIVEILFPGAPRPPSPYVSTGDATSVRHFVTFFRAFGAQELYSLWRERQEQSNGSFLVDASTQTVVDEAFEIALPLSISGHGSVECPQSQQRAAMVNERGASANDGLPSSIPIIEGNDSTFLDSTRVHQEIGDDCNRWTKETLYDDLPELSMASEFADFLFDPAEVETAFDTFDPITEADL